MVDVHFHLAGMRVAQGVVETFLDDAIDMDLPFARQATIEVVEIRGEVGTIRLAQLFDQGADGPSLHAAGLGAVVLELYPATGEASTPIRIGLRVRDVRKTLAAAKAAGGTVVRDHTDADEPSAVVRDPDGHEIALTALTTNGPPPA